MTRRVRIGELLLETGLISPEQLEQALEVQKSDPRRLGEIIVDAKMVTESKVTQVLSQQLSVPWVSLEHVDFSRQLLNLVSSEISEKYNLVPIYVRRSKKRQETLYVAIEDPSDDAALAVVSEFSGLPVRPMIAPPSEIRAAIRAYYLGLPPESVPVSIPSEDFSEAPASSKSFAEDAMASNTAGASMGVKPQPVDFPIETVAVEARDSKMPTPSSAGDDLPKMVTLTMLDGTEVKLPASSKRPYAVAPGELTARDLVEALRAEAGGSDLSEVLGEEVNWQRMFGALLSLLMKKHLIHDWEFVRELRR